LLAGMALTQTRDQVEKYMVSNQSLGTGILTVEGHADPVPSH